MTVVQQLQLCHWSTSTPAAWWTHTSVTTVYICIEKVWMYSLSISWSYPSANHKSYANTSHKISWLIYLINHYLLANVNFLTNNGNAEYSLLEKEWSAALWETLSGSQTVFTPVLLFLCLFCCFFSCHKYNSNKGEFCRILGSRQDLEVYTIIYLKQLFNCSPLWVKKKVKVLQIYRLLVCY